MDDATKAIVEAVKARGYLEGLNWEQLAGRQAVKLVEEVAEVLAAVFEVEPTLGYFKRNVRSVGEQARKVFDNKRLFAHVEVDNELLLRELADLVVVVTVAAHAAGSSLGEVITVAVRKAQSDVARGVRNGDLKP